MTQSDETQKTPEKTPPKLYVTRVRVHVCDQGHHGSTSCGNCGADVKDHPFRCPKCNFWFEREADVSTNVGGSDF